MGLLPRRQREIAEYIREHLETHVVPPTFREIAAHFHLTISTVQESVAALEKKGIVRRIPGRSRNLRLVDDRGTSARSIPILGSTAAGMPITAMENQEGFITVDASLVHAGQVFALKVKGDSMVEAGILDGDLAIIRLQPNVENGEIALAITDDEDATIKRIYKHGRQIELRSENKNYQPLVFDAPRVRIQGKVIGIFRIFN